MLMRVNIRYDICLQQAIVVNYFAQMLSFDRIQPFLQRFACRSCAFGQVSVFLFLSATSRCSVKTDVRIKLFFDMEASFQWRI